MSAVSLRRGELIRDQEATLAQDLVAAQFAAHPGLDERYGPAGRRRCLEDARFHLAVMGGAVAFERPELFVEYIGWAKVMLSARGIPPDDLGRYLSLLRTLLPQRFEPDVAAGADAVLGRALVALPGQPLEVASFLDHDGPLAELGRSFLALLLQGERQQATEQVLAAVDAGTSVRDLYIDVFQRVQREVGRLWQLNLISVAQEHYCSAATQTIMSQLYPRIFTGRRVEATLVAACVEGNLHEIGVRMLADLFELGGWRTYFLGSNVPGTAVLDTVAQRGADVLALSAALTPHLTAVQELIGRLRADGRFADLRVLVGGPPFNSSPDLWQAVGADGHARDADDAVEIAERWRLPTP